MCGSSLPSVILSSLYSPAVHLLSQDTENVVLFSLHFLGVVGPHITLWKGKWSSAAIFASHVSYGPSQFPPCCHLAQIFSFPILGSAYIISQSSLQLLWFWWLLGQSSWYHLALNTL